MYSIEFHPEVFEDFEKLSDEVLKEVAEYFQKYKQDPFKYSSKLYNLENLNLEGYRKTYIANATYRIVIKIEKNIAKVVEVVAVGQRQNKKVYEEAFKRIQK